MNIQLLQRTARQLKLTDTGQLFYESLHSVFSAISDAESIISRTQDSAVGTLRIATNRYFGEQYIIKNLKEFTTLYPELKLDIELADRFPDMEKENFDLLCGISHEGFDHLVRKKIAVAQHILCASPDYLTQFGTPKSLEELKHHRFITHSFRQPDNVLVFNGNQEIDIDVDIRLNDAQNMLQCALNGLGIIKIFNYFVDDHIKNRKLIEILKTYKTQPNTIYIFYKEQKYLPIKIRLFVDFIYNKINLSKATARS